MSKPVLMYAAPELNADLFHAVPLVIVDPFLYAELGDGRRIAVVTTLERDRVEGLGTGIEVIDPDRFGRHELLASGMDWGDAGREVALRACRELGIDSAAVPPEFPLATAEHLRAGGVELEVDAAEFAGRRRVKTGRELEGIRRAQKAADAAMGEAARLLRDVRNGLSCEAIRRAMQDVCRELGADLPEDVIVANGPQSALGHEPGHGPVARGDLVLVDIWPRDKASRCWADMTRTFVAGGGPVPEELARYHALTREALDAVMPAIRAGASGRAIYDLACDVFEAAGEPTQRTKEPGGPPVEDGFTHGLGHGVGLEVHERPSMGLSGEELVAGDVVTVEPGCYRQGFGGVRLEDLVLVTENGAELLTKFAYELVP